MHEPRLRFSTLLFFSLVLMLCGTAHAAERRMSVAVLDFAETGTGRRAADRVADILSTGATDSKSATDATDSKISVVDRGLSRAAARGAGYRGSLNLSLAEARDLGAAIGCDFFVAGDAQTIRRSPSSAPVYYESYASVFVVSASAGRLIMWDRPSVEAATPEQAESFLLDELQTRTRTLYRTAILKAADDERQRRAARPPTPDADDFLDLSTDDAAAANDTLRPPQPFRRLRPPYPDTAARAEAEATVDVTVEIDADGEPGRIEVIRWAGFGLDEAVISTVRQLHFRPAMRDGASLPVRVLLRYNFRRPPKSN